MTVTEEKLLAWEKLAAWEKAEGREALREAIDEIRRLNTCEHCLKWVASSSTISKDAHRLIAGKRICTPCYAELCGKIAKDLSCRTCSAPVREDLLYCSGLSDCWKKGVGLL